MSSASRNSNGSTGSNGSNGSWQSVRAVNLPGKAWPEGSLRRAMLRGVGAAVYGASKGAQFLRDVASEVGVSGSQSSGTSQRLASGLQGVWPVKPLQIGVANAGDWAAQLVASHGVMHVQWHELENADATTTRDGHVLDGMLRCDASGLQLLTMCHVGHDAALRDWSELAAVNENGGGFAQLFPLRQDCAGLSFAGEISVDDVRIARLLIEAACLLSRHPARTELGDKLAGRSANWSDNSEGQASLSSIYTAMEAELESTPEMQGLSSVRSIAAHVLSQWAATSPTITQKQRLEVAELCARLLPGDSFATLRLAAVRFGQLEDASGLDALADAAHALKQSSTKPLSDQTAFLLAELESGMGHPLSLGRVAAGITLASATLDAKELRMYRDDLRDEMRFSAALMGKDQDRFLIEQVFGMLAEQAEGFAQQLAGEDEVGVLPFRSSAVQTMAHSDKAIEGAELCGEEMDDAVGEHHVSTPFAARANPWQLMVRSSNAATKLASMAKPLRLTGAKNKSKSKTKKASGNKARGTKASKTVKTIKSRKRAA